MNYLKRFFVRLLAFVSLISIVDCGVKGRPQAPDTPPYIGKGINADLNFKPNGTEPSPTISPTPSAPPSKKGE